MKTVIISLGLLTLAVALVGCGGGGQQAAQAGATTIDTQGLTATVFLSPTCGCCHDYVDHLKQQGLQVQVVEMMNVAPKKRSLGIPGEMWSCHTTKIGRYFVEGHVPFEIIAKLLSEQPNIDGIALPGMPTGVPGMPGAKEPLTVYAVKDGRIETFLEF
jgi:hypothetical protein